MTMPNWDFCAEIIYAESCKAIEEISVSHSGEIFSFLAYRSDYGNGVNVLSIDTLNNSVARARTHQDRVVRQQQKLFSRVHRWKDAKSYVAIQARRIFDYTPTTSDFAYPALAQINFPEWEAIMRSEGFTQYDLFEGEIVILFWKTVERLIASDAFRSLRISSPFRVGMEFIDDAVGLVVLRILNWPNI